MTSAPRDQHEPSRLSDVVRCVLVCVGALLGYRSSLGTSVPWLLASLGIGLGLCWPISRERLGVDGIRAIGVATTVLTAHGTAAIAIIGGLLAMVGLDNGANLGVLLVVFAFSCVPFAGSVVGVLPTALRGVEPRVSAVARLAANTSVVLLAGGTGPPPLAYFAGLGVACSVATIALSSLEHDPVGTPSIPAEPEPLEP